MSMSANEAFVPHAIITAFVAGIVEADRHYWGYKLPEDLHVVVNQASQVLEKEFGKEEIIWSTVERIVEILRDVVMSSPICKAWNDRPGSMVVSRYSTTGSDKQFIDLDAILLNTRARLKDYVNS